MEFLGDVIKSDLSNLDYFQTEYGLSREDIDSRLSTINKTLNDYVFIDNLEFTILENDDGKISYTYFMSFLEESFPGITKKLGMTEEEYKKTYQYFMSMEDYYYSEETQDKLIDILMRFQTLAETFSESGKDATFDQLTQLQNLYQDLQDVLKIKFSYSVLENGKKVPLTLLDLMNGKDLENATISITLYTEASEFLMDFNLSADMFGEVIGDVEKTPVTKPEASNDKTTSVTVKTVTGGKLPKTASNYTAMVLAGAFLVLLGTVLFKTNGKEKDEAKTL